MESYCGIELSSQKWRVLRLLAQGWSNREISDYLGISPLVCKNYLVVILERTGMGTRLELAVWYWQKCEVACSTMENPSPESFSRSAIAD